MRVVLLDTNVILDFILVRKPWFVLARKIIDLHQSGQIQIHLTASTLTDIYYIAQKESERHVRVDPNLESRNAIRYCISSFEIVSINQDLIEQALNLNGLDFEDDLQIISAISAECDAIITRDIHGFLHSPIPVFDPFAFLNR